LTLKGATALVTGAAGFVGLHLARALAECGARVHGLGNDPPRGELSLEGWHAADLRHPEGLASVIAAVRPDFVVHLAGQTSAARSFERPIETFEVNALGTWNLVEAVRNGAPCARVLTIGSAEVYGPQPAGSCVGESAPFRPVSPYGLSKAAADAFAELAWKRHGLDVVRTRSFGHTGPGQEPRFSVPSWAQQVAAIEAGEAEPVIRVGNLEVTRDLSDVRDVVRAYVTLLERGRSGEAYNVCRGAGIELAEVVKKLAARARVPMRIEADPRRVRTADVSYLVGDPSKIRAETGWQAEIDLERTLDEVLEEWRARRGGGAQAVPPSAEGS